MVNWLFDLATWGIGAICAVVFVIGLLTPEKPATATAHTRLDRRAAERRDRRVENRGGPGGIERRLGPRRLSEHL